MPIKTCTLNGRPGFKWGDSGKCYTYDPTSESSRNRAKKKAILQGVAAKASGYRGDAAQEEKPFITFLKAHGLTEPKIRSRLRRRITARPIPRTVERKYERYLRSLVASWRTLYLQTIDSQLEGLAQEAYAMKPPGSVGIRSDAWPDKLDQLMGQYEAQVTATLAPVERAAQDIGQDVADLNLKQWKQFVSRAVGINIYASEPWLTDQVLSFAKQNSRLITKLADETRADIERIVEDGFQRGRRIENIRKDILSTSKLTPGRFRKTRTRAELIARDQTNKLNGQLSQLRQNEVNVDRYIWHTVADERVRPSHRAMNGLLCRWDNATVYSQDGGKTWIPRSGVQGVEMHPGQDIQCRCYPEADFSSVLGDPGPITKPRKPSKKEAAPTVSRKRRTIPAGEKAEKGKKAKPIKAKDLRATLAVNPAGTIYDVDPAAPPSKTTFNNAIRGNMFETYGVVDAKTNKLLTARRGNRNSVALTPEIRRLTTGNIAIHNHPGSSSFSDADLFVATENRPKVMEVVSEKYTYRLTDIKGDFAGDHIDTYARIRRKIEREDIKRITAGKLDIDVANANYWHKVNSEFARESKLFKYKRIKRK